MGSSLLLAHQPAPTDQIMKVLLLLAGLLLCLHLSEGFSYRGNIMRNRNRGGSSRGYLRNLGGGGRQRMGGMGFGKRAYGFDDGEPIEFYPDTDENGEDLFYPVYPDQEEENGGEAEKRSLSSLKGKRAFGMALSSLRSRGRGKRGALSSLRNQGFVKYNI